MDVRLIDVWVEDPLQYNNVKLYGLNERSNLLQKQKI